MAPHFASELWSGFVSAPNRINTSTKEINWDQGVLEQTWPEIDLNYCLQLVCMVSTSGIYLPHLFNENFTYILFYV